MQTITFRMDTQQGPNIYSTGSYIQYPEINHNGKEYEQECRASLVVQWLRIHLPIQET